MFSWRSLSFWRDSSERDVQRFCWLACRWQTLSSVQYTNPCFSTIQCCYGEGPLQTWILPSLGIVERFVNIFYPYQYTALTNTRFVVLSVFFTQWFITILLTLLSLLTNTPVFSTVYIAVITIGLASLHISIVLRSQETRAADCPLVPPLLCSKSFSSGTSNNSDFHHTGSHSAMLGAHYDPTHRVAAKFAVFQGSHKSHPSFHDAECCCKSFHILLEAEGLSRCSCCLFARSAQSFASCPRI